MTPDLLLDACGFASVNHNDWIGINALVVLFSVTIAGLVYALSNLLPSERRERLKGVASYEVFEAIISLVIIAVLTAFAAAACQAGGQIFGFSDYTGLFAAVENYLGNLLFVNGLSILTTLYTTSIQYTVVANLVYFLVNQGTQLLLGVQQISKIVAPSILSGVVQLSFSTNIDVLFSEYAGVFTVVYGPLLAAAFGSLFILIILLPIIEGGALTVIAPIAIVFRSLSFMGPQLRRTSNVLLALAIGFYFVLPLTIALDSYISGCLGIGLSINAAPCAYPFATSVTGYSVSAISPSLFGSSSSLPVSSSSVPNLAGLGGLSLPTNFYFGSIGSNLDQFFTIFVDAPVVTAGYGKTVAAYFFVSILLIAIDMAITVGFVTGLAKGLDAISNVFGSGGFWRD
jgi:hypothetical protein